jgi:hypothetical protein
MKIGGLIVDKLPCDCGAPYAETCVDIDGTIKVRLHRVNIDGSDNRTIFFETSYDGDDLGMVCTRCGWKL